MLEDADNELAPIFRDLLVGLFDEMMHLDHRNKILERKFEWICAQSEECQRLLTIPGIGLLTATVMYAAIGDIAVLKVVVNWLRGKA